MKTSLFVMAVYAAAFSYAASVVEARADVSLGAMRCEADPQCVSLVAILRAKTLRMRTLLAEFGVENLPADLLPTCMTVSQHAAETFALISDLEFMTLADRIGVECLKESNRRGLL